MPRFKSFILVATILLIGAGCAGRFQETPQKIVPPTAPARVQAPTPSPTPTSNRFDPSTAKAGDTVAGLTLVAIGPVPGVDAPFGDKNVRAEFSGTVTVSGTYDYSFSEFAGADTACFMVSDPAEQSKIPRRSNDTDPQVKFCFKNIGKAKEAFGPSYGSGTATVTIGDYTVNAAPAEVVNEAVLVLLVARG